MVEDKCYYSSQLNSPCSIRRAGCPPELPKYKSSCLTRSSPPADHDRRTSRASTLALGILRHKFKNQNHKIERGHFSIIYIGSEVSKYSSSLTQVVEGEGGWGKLGGGGRGWQKVIRFISYSDSQSWGRGGRSSDRQKDK